MTPELFGIIADTCGILSFIASIIIWVSTRNIKGQLNLYKRNQKDIIQNLKSHRESIYEDGVYSLPVRSSIRTELYTILKCYGSVLNFTEHITIHLAIHTLSRSNPNNVNIEKLCIKLDKIIARFNKKEKT